MGRRTINRRTLLRTMAVAGAVPALLTVPGRTAHASGTAAEPLKWAPPDTTGYTPIEITTAQNLQLDPGTDYVVTKLQTTGGFQIFGGRNIVIVGGEVKNGGINFRRSTTDPMADSRIVHVEGVLFSGTSAADGIGGDAPEAVIQIENCRIEGRKGVLDGSHADVLQFWGGVKELRVDGLSGFSNYQGFFTKVEASRTDKPIGIYKLRRVDLHETGAPYERGLPILMWFGSSDGFSPLRFELERGSVWVENDPANHEFAETLYPEPAPGHIATDGIGTYATWPTLTPTGMSGVLVQDGSGGYGRVYHGGGRWGQYVPAGRAGLGYVSPGYA